MSDTLTTLETDLVAFATPQKAANANSGTATDWENGTATATPLLTTVATLLNTLGAVEGVGPAITAMTGGISTVLPDVASALNKIGEAITSIESQTGAGTTPAQVMQALGNALSLAQSLSPNQNPALASGSQLFNNLSELLGNNTPDAAAATLFQIAQQLTAIGKAL
jgi:hypothetical protein